MLCITQGRQSPKVANHKESKMSSWFSGGFARAKEINEQQAAGVLEFGNNEKSRFWIKVGSPREIIFLDDFTWTVEMDGSSVPITPFCRWEHKIEIGGDWRNCVYVTCTRGTAPCKFCDIGYKRVYMGGMSILDVTPYKDDAGKTVVRPRKRLIIATSKTLALIESKKAKKGNLVGWKYSAARHQEKDPRVGSDYEAETHVEDVRALAKSLGAPELNLDPYGFTADKAFEFYRKLFAPMPVELQEKMIKSGNIEDGSIMRKFRDQGGSVQPTRSPASGDSEASGDSDEVVPF